MEDAKIDFLCPTLKGPRFEQHGLPLDITKDFHVFDEMVRSVAKTLYKRERSAQRIPRNFLEDISIQITDLQEGSTIPKICLIVTQGASMLFPYTNIGVEFAIKARDCIVKTIEDIDSDAYVDSDDHITKQQLTYFNRFGCSLRDDETILFPLNNGAKQVEFNQGIRKKLIARSSSEVFRMDVTLYGAISELDLEKKSFMLNLPDGQRITIQKYDDDFVEDLVLAFSKYQSGQKVKILGLGIYSKKDRLSSVEFLKDVSLLEPVDFGYRIAEIAALKDGWFDGDGHAFDHSRLQHLAKLYKENYSLETPPYLYPMPEGNIQAEWESQSWRITLDIDLMSFKGELFALDLSNDHETIREIDLGDGSGWAQLCAEVKSMIGEA